MASPGKVRKLCGSELLVKFACKRHSKLARLLAPNVKRPLGRINWSFNYTFVYVTPSARIINLANLNLILLLIIFLKGSQTFPNI